MLHPVVTMSCAPPRSSAMNGATWSMIHDS
jgi:hypothetical protein